MKTRRVTWIVIVGMLALQFGCSGGDDDDTTDPLTVANLQGTYDLDVPASRLEDVIIDDLEVSSGVLDIDATSLVFIVMGALIRSFDIVDATTLALTDADGNTVEVQASLTDDGGTLTLVDSSNGDILVFIRRGPGRGNALTVDNLQGEYDLDVANSSSMDLSDDPFMITEAVLDVTGMTLTFMVTGTLEGPYSIVNQTTITVTTADGDMIDVAATLSESATRLRLVDEDDNVYLFDKR